jgi:hypothetical protein
MDRANGLPSWGRKPMIAAPVLPAILPGWPAPSSRSQWGFVVRDIEAAMRHFVEVFGIGPFIHIPDVGRGCRFTYDGQETPLAIDAAYSYLGDVQIELIALRNDAPSPYRDFLKAGREGLQHAGFWVEEQEAVIQHLEGRGLAGRFTVLLPGALRPTVYFDGPAALGTMIEVAELTPAKARLYDTMAALCRSWDGTRPIRRYDRMGDFAAEAGVGSW